MNRRRDEEEEEWAEEEKLKRKRNENGSGTATDDGASVLRSVKELIQIVKSCCEDSGYTSISFTYISALN